MAEKTQAPDSWGDTYLSNITRFHLGKCLLHTLILSAKNLLVFGCIIYLTYNAPTKWISLMGDMFTPATEAEFLLWLALYLIEDTFVYFMSILGDAIVVVMVSVQLKLIKQSATSALKRVIHTVLFFAFIDNVAVGVSSYFFYLSLLIWGPFFWITNQSIAVEQLGLRAAFKRSMALTEGNRLQMAGVVGTIIVMWRVDGWVAELARYFNVYEATIVGSVNLLDLTMDILAGVFIATLMATTYCHLARVYEHRRSKRIVDAFS